MYLHLFFSFFTEYSDEDREASEFLKLFSEAIVSFDVDC